MKLKLRKIGNSQGVYLPKEMVSNYNIGDYVDLEVITEDKSKEVITDNTPIVITSPKKEKFNTVWCDKHTTMKGNCGCK